MSHLTRFEEALCVELSKVRKELRNMENAYLRVLKAKSDAIAIALRGDVYAEEVVELNELEQIR